MPGRSLRTRLLLLLAVVTSLACLLVGSLALVAIDHSLRGNLDRQLTAQPGGGGQRHEVPPPGADPGCGTVRVPSRPNSVFACISDGTVEDARVFPAGSSFGSSGTALTRTSVFLSVPATDERRPVTRSVPGLGDYRLVAFGTPSTGVVRVIGYPLAEVTRQVHQVALDILLVSLGTVLLVVLGGAALLRRALAPLQRVAGVAARVSEMPLERGEVALGELVPARDADPRTEAGQVGSALNRLLVSMDSALNARHASEMRVRQFVADASHELRTPLAAIRGYAELTRRHRATLPEDTAYAMTRVESEAARMTSLVEDLLLLARLDSGRPLAAEPVDLTSVVVDAVSDAHAVSQDHRWELDLPDEPVEVVGDAGRLHQVVANLLSNARTHTPPGTAVEVALRREDGTCVVTVSDDGPGIPPDLLPDVFERFARGDSSRSRGAGSTGLGLAIVAAIVTAHGGAVGVGSVPGRTRFTVRLPLTPSADRPVDALLEPARRASEQPQRTAS
ncbi:sensor histidine kinase [Motilibacter rhizosphaerae]|uniref:sensor histidine kinase n=1 Tax=Motilibacter rhizosphaerae TaxID=598652 RepID=UPI0013EEAB7A